MSVEKLENQLLSHMLFNVDDLPFGELVGQFPGWIHLNRLDDLSVFWMSEKMKNDLQVNLNDVVEAGPDFLRSIINQETEKRVIPQILSYLKSGDENDVLGFIQMIRKNKNQPYNPYYTTIKKSLKFNCLFCQSVPLVNYNNKVGEYINLYGFNEQLEKDFGNFKELTKREKEVLKLIAQGKTNKSVGLILHISELTVKTHRQNIRKKLESNCLQDLIRTAMAFNLK